MPAAEPAVAPSPDEPLNATKRLRMGSFEWALLAIAVAGLFFRVGYIAATRADTTLCPIRDLAGTVTAEPVLCGDALYYSAQADLLASGHGFADIHDVTRPAADHPPLTALVLAPISAVWPGDTTSPTAHRLVMAVFGFLVILAIGLLGRRVGGSRGPPVGLIAAALAAVNANFWMNDVVVMSETLATLGVVLALCATYRFVDRPTWSRAATVGALVGFAALARAELLLLGPIMFAPVALWARTLRWPERVGRIAVAGALALVVVAPWTLYNLTRFDKPVVMSTNDGLTVLGANCDEVYGIDPETGRSGDRGGIGFWNLGCALKVDDRVPAGADQSVASKVYRDIGLEYLRTHKDRLRPVAQFRLLRGWGLYAPDEMAWLNTGEGRTPWATALGFYQWWLLLVPAAFGGHLLRTRGRPLWPLASMAAIVTITLLGFYGIVRFRIAADVAAIVLAAVALDAAWQWWRARPRRSLLETNGRTSTDALEKQPVVEATAEAGKAEAGKAGAVLHFPCLDAYRGIGMTMVLLNHAAYSTGFLNQQGRIPQLLTPFLARLDLSVPMFFVMSGFLLFRPFAKATLTDRDLPDLRTFYRRRVLRILPAYWLSLGLIAVLFGLQVPGLRGWIGNIFLLPAIGAPVSVCDPSGACHVAYGLTQAWSIGVEATFYLTLPLAAMVLHRLCRGRDQRGRLVVLLVGMAVLYALGTAFRAVVVGADPSWSEQSLLWLPMFTDLFAIGMTLAVVSAAVSVGRPLPRLLAWLGDHPNAAWALAAMVFLVVTRMKYPNRPFGLHDADGSSDYLPRQFLYGIASALWLAPAIFGDQTVGVVRRLLRARPLVYLGAISLSFYLWHLVIIDQVKLWTVRDFLGRQELAAHPPEGNALAGVATFTGDYLRVVVISWLVSLLVASVFYRFVEVPFLHLKDAPLSHLWPRRSEGAASGDAVVDARPAGNEEPARDDAEPGFAGDPDAAERERSPAAP